MALKKKDFIEIEFTGKTKDGEIFDSNVKENLEQSGKKIDVKPFVYALGEGMFLQGVDDFLVGKDIGRHKVGLSPEKAFGKREPSLIKMIPTKVFFQQRINPVPGAMFNFDGTIGKIITVSGGRVITDFNHPLAGKEIIYEINVLRKVEDVNEKISSMNQFFFRKDFKFSVDEEKLILEVEKSFVKFVGLFQDKFKDLLGLGLEIKEVVKESKKEVEEVVQE